MDFLENIRDFLPGRLMFEELDRSDGPVDDDGEDADEDEADHEQDDLGEKENHKD